MEGSQVKKHMWMSKNFRRAMGAYAAIGIAALSIYWLHEAGTRPPSGYFDGDDGHVPEYYRKGDELKVKKRPSERWVDSLK